MGTFYYCDDCMFCGPTTIEATHLDVKMWNGESKDLCDECYEERKKDNDLKEESDDNSNFF
jgi:hypothetical protein